MKGPKGYMDLGTVFDEIFEAAQDIHNEFSRKFSPFGDTGRGDRSRCWAFDEKDISLSFQGDYMVFSANTPRPDDNIIPGENSAENRYFKHRLKMKDIQKQKYFVPLDKYAQEKVKAVYKNGILRVSVPPKDEPDQSDGIRIEIIKEED
jgi:hypothetical protein